MQVGTLISATSLHRKDSESRGGRIGSYPAAGQIERFDPLHVVAVELKIERADVLLEALEPNGFWDSDQTAVEMPANDDLCWRFSMLGGNVNKRSLAQ
jgi:hypothetical protein